MSYNNGGSFSRYKKDIIIQACKDVLDDIKNEHLYMKEKDIKDFMMRRNFWRKLTFRTPLSFEEAKNK